MLERFLNASTLTCRSSTTRSSKISEEITSINFGHRAEVQKSRLPLQNPPPPRFP